MSKEIGKSTPPTASATEYTPDDNHDVDLRAPGMRRKYNVESALNEAAAGQTVALRKIKDLTGLSLQMTDFDISLRARNIKTGKWNEPVEWTASRDGMWGGEKGVWDFEINLDDSDEGQSSPLGPAGPHVGYTAIFTSPAGRYRREKGHVMVASLDACRPPFPLTKKAEKLRRSGSTGEAERIFGQYFERRR